MANNANEELINQIVKVAVQTAIDYMEQKIKEDRKKRVDRRLRNTKLLLINYKNFKLHCSDIKDELTKLDDPDLLDNLDTEELVIESIKRSKQRTLVMVRFIDRMLEIYKRLALTSSKPEEKRRYETIYKLFITEEEFTAEMVAKCHNVDKRTVHRDVKDAVESLSALIFGIDSIRFDI